MKENNIDDDYDKFRELSICTMIVVANRELTAKIKQEESEIKNPNVTTFTFDDDNINLTGTLNHQLEELSQMIDIRNLKYENKDYQIKLLKLEKEIKTLDKSTPKRQKLINIYNEIITKKKEKCEKIKILNP